MLPLKNWVGLNCKLLSSHMILIQLNWVWSCWVQFIFGHSPPGCSPSCLPYLSQFTIGSRRTCQIVLAPSILSDGYEIPSRVQISNLLTNIGNSNALIRIQTATAKRTLAVLQPPPPPPVTDSAMLPPNFWHQVRISQSLF